MDLFNKKKAQRKKCTLDLFTPVFPLNHFISLNCEFDLCSRMALSLWSMYENVTFIVTIYGGGLSQCHNVTFNVTMYGGGMSRCPGHQKYWQGRKFPSLDSCFQQSSTTRQISRDRQFHHFHFQIIIFWGTALSCWCDWCGYWTSILPNLIQYANK